MDNNNATAMTLASWKTQCPSIQVLKKLNASTDHLEEEYLKNIQKCYTSEILPCTFEYFFMKNIENT